MLFARKNKVLERNTTKQKNISIFDTYEIFENSFFITLENLVLYFNYHNCALNGSFFTFINIKSN